MAGIDNITAEILGDAQKTADGILAAADKDASAVLEEARKKADRIATEADRKASASRDAAKQRTASRVETLEKRQVLAARQQVVEEVIDQAYTELKNQPAESYWAMVYGLITAYAEAKEGEILFDAKDLDRMDADVKAQIGDAAQKAGGTLTIVSEPADIEAGFILRYGGIEDNCTLKALFRDKKDQMQDAVRHILWQE